MLSFEPRCNAQLRGMVSETVTVGLDGWGCLTVAMPSSEGWYLRHL